MGYLAEFLFCYQNKVHKNPFFQYEVQIKYISKQENRYLRKAGFTIMKVIKISCKFDVELYDSIVKKREGKYKKIDKMLD